jgi:hypothetical protein
MLDWLMIAAAVIAIARIADAENRSSLIWGGITLAACVLCTMLVPIALLGIGLGFLLAFAAMFVVKMIESR